MSMGIEEMIRSLRLVQEVRLWETRRDDMVYKTTVGPGKKRAGSCYFCILLRQRPRYQRRFEVHGEIMWGCFLDDANHGRGSHGNPPICA